MVDTIQNAYAQAVFAGKYTADAAQEAVLPFFDDIRMQLDSTPVSKGVRGLFSKQREQPKGLYIWGGVGRGKSMLMDLFVDVVQAPGRRIHFHAFMQEVHGALHEARKTEVEDALIPVAAAIASEIKFLALDEMQINDITDAMIVGRLFEQLMSLGVVLVTTSNRPPDDLYLDGLNRDLFLPFIDLLNSRLQVHELTSAVDYRQGQLAGRTVYFSPNNAEALKAIDAIWQELAKGKGEKLVLRLKGRETVLSRFHNGVARATFWELCGNPLGAADYLALADAIRVLILENIPRLGRSNYNEAKRFVILIDALYEARVKLVASAADIPERLYLEGAGSFEFERTASRLREMQSQSWGSDAP